MTGPPRQRPAHWKWWFCGLLLFASMINYMDRQTLANVAVRITDEFKLNQEQYGNLEWVFGWAFAVGSLIFGILADRVSVRGLYPAVVLLWSATGFITGWVQSYSGLLVCRTLLGFFGGALAVRLEGHATAPRAKGSHHGQQHSPKRHLHRRRPHPAPHEGHADQRSRKLAAFVSGDRRVQRGVDRFLAVTGARDRPEPARLDRGAAVA